MKNTIYIVGDVHGKVQELIELVKDHSYSIALGDIGGRYNIIENHLDPTRHRLLAGNHEHFDHICSVQNFLGDFGEWLIPNYPRMFFIRGAWSIDRKFQRADDREELTYNQCQIAFEQFKLSKPEIMFTHDAPLEIVKKVGNPEAWIKYGWEGPQYNRTQELLQQCFEYHQPKLWFFGHHHQSIKISLNNCDFHCLKELEVKELMSNLEIIQIKK